MVMGEEVGLMADLAQQSPDAARASRRWRRLYAPQEPTG